MMDSAKIDQESELLMRVAILLEDLGPFTPSTRREDKWRTTEQIANELELFGREEVDHLDRMLREHEARCLERLEKGLLPEALIRRAKYPDRTTALPLWGSVKHHGQPWAGYRPDRSDPPDDIPSTLAVPDDAPHVFLSHTHQDAGRALHLAEALAETKIGCWRFETHIDQRGDIADCVRQAIVEAACVVALMTRWSIASLWILTELHTALKGNVPVALVIDSDDPLLMQLLQTVCFPNPNEDFDLSVRYDRGVVHQLKQNYSLRESTSRTARYEDQVRDFLATLPSYLGSIPPHATQRIWRPAFAFPRLPGGWSGAIKLAHWLELSRILMEKRGDSGA